MQQMRNVLLLILITTILAILSSAILYFVDHILSIPFTIFEHTSRDVDIFNPSFQ